mmetsp:Transcript_140840/g.392571  ORF Transcript_140840/g.392571 Transcript_140840/m.392571 type:complete len:201 (+) Transcript_140840:409-1011(+)
MAGELASKRKKDGGGRSLLASFLACWVNQSNILSSCSQRIRSRSLSRIPPSSVNSMSCISRLSCRSISSRHCSRACRLPAGVGATTPFSRASISRTTWTLWFSDCGVYSLARPAACLRRFSWLWLPRKCTISCALGSACSAALRRRSRSGRGSRVQGTWVTSMAAITRPPCPLPRRPCRAPAASASPRPRAWALAARGKA